jgi:hypothetical protein
MYKDKEKEQHILSMWLSRPDEKRRQNDTEPFTNEVWDTGFRLAKHPHTHYQHVMELIRCLVKDGE